MNQLLVFVFLSLTIALHEIAHAIIKHKNGVEIKELGIGFGKNLFSFSCARLFGGCMIFVRLIPLGAYVKPTDKGRKTLDSLPLLAQAECYGAGILANVLFGVLLVGLSFCIERPHPASYAVVVSTNLLLAFCLFHAPTRRFVSCAALPTLGFALLCLLVWTLFDSPEDAVGGPVMLVQMSNQHAKNAIDLLNFSGAVSVSIGALNLLPTLPLDGGRIVRAILENYQLSNVKRLFERFSVVFALVLIAAVFVSDFLRLF